MQKHTKIYFTALGYDKTDFIPCEISGKEAVDINHIDNRGMGGDPTGEKDRIENLMAMTRELHHEHGDSPKSIVMMYETHREFLHINRVKYDNAYFQKQIEHFKAKAS